MDKTNGAAKAAGGTTTAAMDGMTKTPTGSRGEEKEVAKVIKEIKVGTPAMANMGLETQATSLQTSTTKFQAWWLQGKALNRL